MNEKPVRRTELVYVTATYTFVVVDQICVRMTTAQRADVPFHPILRSRLVGSVLATRPTEFAPARVEQGRRLKFEDRRGMGWISDPVTAIVPAKVLDARPPSEPLILYL